MYSIDFCRDSNLLDILWTGVFSPEATVDYARDLAAQFVEHDFRPGYRLRIDMSVSGIQPRNTLDRFAACFSTFPTASRIAIITPSTLMRMQVRRVMTQSYLQVFTTAEEGLAWLMASEAAAA